MQGSVSSWIWQSFRVGIFAYKAENMTSTKAVKYCLNHIGHCLVYSQILMSMPDPLRYQDAPQRANSAATGTPTKVPPIARKVVLRHFLKKLDERISKFAIEKPWRAGQMLHAPTE